MPQNLKRYVKWYYNNNTNCENGKYIRIKRNKRFSDNKNATIMVDISVYKPHRSKKEIKTDFLTMAVIYLEKMSWDRNDSASTLIMENDLCHKYKESCQLFNTRFYYDFDKNRSIDFAILILACDLPNTSGRRIVHYMMGYNNSNLIIEGTGNIDSEHPSNKMVVQFSKLNQKNNIFSKCTYFPLKDKSDENVEKIKSRLTYTLGSQNNNKMLQYSVDTCNSQNLVLYWVYGVGKRSCGGCTTEMECSDFKFIENTYSCDEVQQKVFNCLQYMYHKI